MRAATGTRLAAARTRRAVGDDPMAMTGAPAAATGGGAMAAAATGAIAVGTMGGLFFPDRSRYGALSSASKKLDDMSGDDDCASIML